MKANKFLLNVVIFVGTVLLLAACASPVAEQPPAGTQSPASTPFTAPTQSPVEVTAAPEGTEVPLPGTGASVPQGWKTYTNSTYHFTFAYPGEWEVCGESEQSIQLCKPMEEPGVGPLPSFYVATIPPGEELSDLDFLSGQAARAYLALPVGEAALTEPNAVPAEYFSYTRLPDATVAGWTAGVIENQKVWEAPEEIADRRALLVTEVGIFNVGSYYASPEDLQTYERILETFEFTP